MDAKEIPSVNDKFSTVSETAQSSILIQASKFIAFLAPAQSEEEVAEIIRLRQRRFHDASHHCPAHRIGRPASLVEHSSDAGGPSGTAGRPILDALRAAGLENVVCVVTRYFGGTKLGTGGLKRAYGAAARAAIAQAEIVERTVVRDMHIDFDHDRTGAVYRALEEYGLHLTPGVYDSRAHGSVRVPISMVEPLQARLAELSLTGIDVRVGELGVV